MYINSFILFVVLSIIPQTIIGGNVVIGGQTTIGSGGFVSCGVPGFTTPTVICESFETGTLDQFTALGTAAADQTHIHSGAWSALISLPNLGCCNEFVDYLIPGGSQGTTLYFRSWFYFPTGFLWGDDGNYDVGGSLCDSRGACGEPTKWEYFYSSSASGFKMYLDSGPNAANCPQADTPGAAGCGHRDIYMTDDTDQAQFSVKTNFVPDGNWHSIEVYLDNTTHTQKVWWDGVLVLNDSTTQMVSCATCVWQEWKVGQYTNNAWPSNESVWVDDLAISTSRIGP